VNMGENGLKANGATLTTHFATKDEPDSVWSSHGSWTTMFNPCITIPHYDPSLALARPFLFAVRDLATGMILFVGQVARPAGELAPPDWTETSGFCLVPVEGSD